jgi:hypothetical protein
MQFHTPLTELLESQTNAISFCISSLHSHLSLELPELFLFVFLLSMYRDLAFD